MLLIVASGCSHVYIVELIHSYTCSWIKIDYIAVLVDGSIVSITNVHHCVQVLPFHSVMLTLVWAQGQSFWTTWAAQEMRTHYWTVLGQNTTVFTLKMPVSSAHFPLVSWISTAWIRLLVSMCALHHWLEEYLPHARISVMQVNLYTNHKTHKAIQHNTSVTQVYATGHVH